MLKDNSGVRIQSQTVAFRVPVDMYSRAWELAQQRQVRLSVVWREIATRGLEAVAESFPQATSQAVRDGR